MTYHKLSIAACLLALGGTALAHTGAQGVVLERMQGMSAMADAMKALAPSVRGLAPHDPAVVQSTAAVLSEHAGQQMVDLFEPGTGAAPSEAAPLIWERPEDFARLSMDLDQLAADLDAAAQSPEDTAQVFAQIGGSCSACHEDYRIKR